MMDDAARRVREIAQHLADSTDCVCGPDAGPRYRTANGWQHDCRFVHEAEACIATALRELEAERDKLKDCRDEPCNACVACLQHGISLANECIVDLRTRLARVEGALRDLIGASPPVCQCQACINAHAALMPDTTPRFEDPVDGTDRDLKWIRDNP